MSAKSMFPEKNGITKKISIVRVALASLAFYVLIGLALFLSAGRLDWMAGWAFLVSYALFGTVTSLWIGRNDPDLLAERMTAEGRKITIRERVVMFLARICALALYVVAGLDAGRYGWSTIPAGARGLGWIMGIASALLIFWVFRTNTFASSVVRLQSDRGHRVIDNGPYRYVRHPMYVGTILLFLGLPLVLGSWWAFIPAGMLVLTFILRTAQEDQLLIEGLEGYDQFSVKTRFRLFPGVW
jgi:protein-S-isoprenylcysteine O-methyltransferase Ste14